MSFRFTEQDTTIIHDKNHPEYSEETEQLQLLRQLTVSVGSGGAAGKTGAEAADPGADPLFSPVSDTSYAPVFSSEDEAGFISPKRKLEEPVSTIQGSGAVLGLHFVFRCIVVCQAPHLHLHDNSFSKIFAATCAKRNHYKHAVTVEAGKR